MRITRSMRTVKITIRMRTMRMTRRTRAIKGMSIMGDTDENRWLRRMKRMRIMRRRKTMK